MSPHPGPLPTPLISFLLCPIPTSPLYQLVPLSHLGCSPYRSFSGSYSSFISQLKCYLLRKALPDHLSTLPHVYTIRLSHTGFFSPGSTLLS